MSTIDAETSETIKRVIEKDQRAEYLAAPVSGGEKDAKEGALLILAAAERARWPSRRFPAHGETVLVDGSRVQKRHGCENGATNHDGWASRSVSRMSRVL